MIDPHGDEAEIDIDLVPLVETLWRLGFETISCCQDVGESLEELGRHFPHMMADCERLRGQAQVDLPIEDGLAFLTAVARAGPRDNFYVRMIHWVAPNAWEVTARADDIATHEEDKESEFDLSFYLLVRFPRSDLEEIIRRLERWERQDVHAPAPIDWSSVEVIEDDQ